MKRLALILGIGALVAPANLLAVPAEGGSWTKSCQANQTTKTLEGGGIACYTPAAGSSNEAASPILSVNDCESIDVYLWTDFDGDGTACTIDWAIQGCPPGANALSTNGKKNAACANLPGVSALSGNDAQANLGATEIRVVGQAAGANPDSCRIIVKCSQGAQQP